MKGDPKLRKERISAIQAHRRAGLSDTATAKIMGFDRRYLVTLAGTRQEWEQSEKFDREQGDGSGRIGGRQTKPANLGTLANESAKQQKRMKRNRDGTYSKFTPGRLLTPFTIDAASWGQASHGDEPEVIYRIPDGEECDQTVEGSVAVLRTSHTVLDLADAGLDSRTETRFQPEFGCGHCGREFFHEDALRLHLEKLHHHKMGLGR